MWFHHNVTLTVSLTAAEHHHGARHRQRAVLAALRQEQRDVLRPEELGHLRRRALRLRTLPLP